MPPTYAPKTGVGDIGPRPGYVSFGHYEMTDEGLYTEDKNSEPLFVSGPFEVLGRARNPNGEGWGRLLSWSDDDGRVHIFCVPDADLHGERSALCANLASRGLKIATGRAVRMHLF